MNFWDDLSDALTGAGKRELAAKQLESQLELAAMEAALEKERLAVKTSPEALKAKNVRYIVLGIVGAVLIILIIKWIS